MIMNKNKSVFAVINDAPKKTDYTGVATDTADVHVDNVNREIRVDVDVSGLLGETATTAYPGYLGATALKTATTALKAVESEIARSASEDERINKNLEDNYATKQFVSEQLSIASKTTFIIVDNIDFVNNKVIINNQEQTPVDGIIYLLKITSEENSYTQYTIIDNKLVGIGGTNIDLTNYVSKTELEEYVNQILMSIEFIDAGDPASI